MAKRSPLEVVAMLTATATLAAGVVGCARNGEARGFNAPPGALSQEAPRSNEWDFAKEAHAPKQRPDQVGLATWYGEKFEGKPTANGERFDVRGMTAAHLTLPFGTWVEVRRPDTGRAVRVRINDRGPHGDKRKIIDLSRAAAEALDIITAGYVRVELRVVRGP